MNSILFRIISVSTLLMTLACTHPSIVDNGGGGSEVEVVGQVFVRNGPASHTQVKLINNSYDPSTMQEIGDSMIDTTDASGRYCFKKVPDGTYNVQAVQLTQRTRMLITGVEVNGDTFVTVPADTLRKPGSIQLTLSESAVSDGYATIPGTDISAFVASGSREIILDSVPAGKIPEIRYYTLHDTVTMIRHNVLVTPSETTILKNAPKSKEVTFYLNTSASGAAIHSDIYHFPVLVRLTENNFNFAQSTGQGEDILFTDSNHTSLPFEIEHWDSISGRAEIWVMVDTIYGDDSTQLIHMYWGDTAKKYTSSSAVFDTAAGFQGVWHLGESIQDSTYDATANRYTGVSTGTAIPATGPGIIGNCKVFDGTSDYIMMNNTAKSKLDFPENGYYTISAWVYLDTADNASHCIVSKGFEQYYLRSTYISLNLPSTKPLWEFVEFNDAQKWQTSNGSANSKQWVFLTGVREGQRQFLYSNGVLIDSTVDIWQNTVSRNTTNNLHIGRFEKQITLPVNEGYCYFKGSIDEVRIQSKAMNADWIKLCYMNQQPDQKLVKFKN